MDRNRLKMNSTKTEFILFGFGTQLIKCTTQSINVVNDKVDRVKSIKYLGATLDEELNLKQHIKQKCKTAIYGVQRIKSIRSSLTREAAEVLALGIVISHLDYANAMFTGLPQVSLKRLQRVQSMAARVVLGKSAENFRSVECLKILHWLPICLRIKFKVLVLVYKSLYVESTPGYIRSMLQTCTAQRTLRSSSMHLKLQVPATKRKTFASRSFSVQGPIWWNELPNNIKQLQTVKWLQTVKLNG